MSFSTRARFALAAACAALVAPAAFAQAIPVRLAQGEAQLPTSGLVIDLPAKAGIRYDISGSWALSDGGASFDTRDIVDEIETATGNVATGNWVLSGYFTAGGCSETLAAAKLDAAWTQDATLWGESWSARGGVFTFENALGRRPAVVLCRGTEGGPTLLLYHFLANQPETLPQAAVMESVGKSGPLAAASKSFTAVRAKPIFPTRRTEVRNRGSEPAARRVTLALSGLEVDLPPDGYLWLPDSSDTADFFDGVLVYGTARIGSVQLTDLSFPERQSILAELLIGEREQLFINIARVTYGDAKDINHVCPSCGNEAETTVLISEDIEMPTMENPYSLTHTMVTSKGDTLTYRLAIGSDQMALLKKKNSSAAEQTSLMISQCVVKVNDKPVIDPVGMARGLSMGDRRKLMDHLVEDQPSPDMSLTMPCINCSFELTLPLSWGDIFRP